MKLPILLIGFALAAVAQNAVEQPPEHLAAHPVTESLANVKRIYVEALAGDHTAEAIRQLIIASLQQSHLFVITENPDRADVTMKGAANDTVFTDTFDSQEGVNARANAGGYSSKVTNSRGEGGYGGVSVGENEAHHIKERKHESFATIRLCNRDGDVLWATTQESRGAKFRGAAADVADKVMRQLQADLAKAQHPKAPATDLPR
jgi:hypothetical protein